MIRVHYVDACSRKLTSPRRGIRATITGEHRIEYEVDPFLMRDEKRFMILARLEAVRAMAQGGCADACVELGMDPPRPRIGDFEIVGFIDHSRRRA
jgi:hypothetical protein